jgi:hypothetical protein
LKKYDFIFLDEDVILNSILPNQCEILLTELQDILGEIDENSGLAKKIRAALDAAKTRRWISLPGTQYVDAYRKILTPVDIPAFCKAKYFYLKTKSDENNLEESNRTGDGLIFFKPMELRRGLNYIMLSATADEKICNFFFGANRVKFYECKNAKYKGTLNQYNEYTLSRWDIAKRPGILNELKKMTGVENCITFKKHKQPGDLAYFGKTTGINAYTGKDLNVIGTPHHPEFVYKLIAFTILKAPFNFDTFYANAELRYQEITYNGNKFWFYTFDKKAQLLRDIQLWMIGSELEQAVGRARLIRHDCTVNFFSNYPLAQAVIRELDLMQEYT